MDSDSDYEAEIPHFPRDLPNILITGTPGTGKTTTSEMAAEATGLTHINVGDLVKAKSLHEGLDTEYDSYILDEDKLVDEMEEMMRPGGKIVDFHTCEIFPERWFDLVIVLRTDNGVLYPRLESRGYNAKKINENMECEIMQVVLEEARESYEEQIVIELESNSIEQMEENVKDEQGRRRFHGAFTGGFSAGYYNTVGSAEGWTPSEFVSSRSNRSNIKSSRPEDFMDEEDKQMLSDATRITATDDFGASGSAQRELARKRATAMNMQASGSVLGALSDAMIDDLIIPTSESIGARLLKRMGWKPGQGIGPHSAIIVFANKSNHFGLGFNPHKDAPEFDVSMQAQSGSRYLSGADSGVTGSRLGFGLLSDSEGDEDESGVFGTGSNSRRRAEMEMDLDIAVSLDKRQKSSYGSVPSSNSRSAPILAYCSDGRPPLAGFILIATKASDPKWYIAPIVPSDFIPRHIFTSDGKTTSSTKQHRQSKLTADDRALVLGETPIDAPRRSVFEYISAENKNRLDGALGFVLDVHGEKHLRKDHWEVPTIEKSAAEAALRGFIPFSDDISKQRRYKQYLNVQAGLSSEKIDMVEGFSGEDMTKELNEFVQAARIFKPMSTSMSSRFATATKIIEFQQPSPGLRTGAEIQASLAGKPSSEHRSIERMEVPKSQAAKAAEMGMFGPLTRSTADFYPNKLLCKRFNVPDPHPEHKDVGPDTAKDLLDKATMDSMLTEGSSARFSLSKEASSTVELTDNSTVPEVEQEQAEPLTQVPQERPPMDIFKAIFDDSDSGSDSDIGMDADDAGVNLTASGQPVKPVSDASAMDQDKADVAVVTQMENELEGDSVIPLRHIFTKRTSKPTRSPSPRAGSPSQAAKTGLRRVDDRARDVESEVESDDAQIGPRLDLSERRTTTESAGRVLSRKPRSSGADTHHHPNTYQEIGPGHSTLTSRSNNRDSSEEFIGPPVPPTSAVESTFSAAEEPGRSGQGRKEADDYDHEARRESRSSKQRESLVSRKDESERSRSRRSRSERSSSSRRRSLSIEHNSSKSRRRVEVVGNHSAASSDSDDHEHPTESRSDGPLSARKSGKKTRGADDRVGDRQDANSHSDRARKDRSSTRRHKEHRSRPSDRDRELGHSRSSSSLRHKHSRAVREPSRRDDRDRDPTQERSKDRHAKAYEDEDDSDSLWVEKEVTSTLIEKESEAPGSVDPTQAVVPSRSRPRAAARLQAAIQVASNNLEPTPLMRHPINLSITHLGLQVSDIQYSQPP
ncbi:hypothetical protein EC957_003682 [Mortierella hygrophila]|uniref:Adenylate kinase isoenzyme 6 homolog n=1 Tax=Mortierella hygrophila TaxID=979708 RepID=A0A9P6F1K9_9FUNG|nr:hypothetical protein EC957_003682 [Mortierella hygrophila]